LLKINRPVIGWIAYDFANSAFATTVLAVIFPLYFANTVAGGSTGTTIFLPWGELSVPGASMWSFLVAFSTAIVAVASPLLGAMADKAALRKRILVICCYVGVIATIALSSVGEGAVLLGAFIFIIANSGFTVGNVFYNAFLLDVSKRESYGRISGLAYGAGYIGGGLCLVLNLIMLQKPQLIGFQEGAFGIGDCIIVAGIWWGLFALPTSLWLKERSKPDIRHSTRELFSIGWKRLSGTFHEIRRYRQLVRFLIAFLLFNDGVQTVIIMASIYGAEVVGLSVGELIAFFIMVQATAFIGSLFFGWLADLIGNRSTLLICLVVWLAIVIWAYFLGWLIDPRTEYYVLGVLTGIVLGGTQSIARAMQAAFTPLDRSAEFFGFFSISGRFASVFGPLVYGSAILITGGVKPGILALGIFFLAGAVILCFVNESEGMLAAEADSKED